MIDPASTDTISAPIILPLTDSPDWSNPDCATDAVCNRTRGQPLDIVLSAVREVVQSEESRVLDKRTRGQQRREAFGHTRPV